MLEDKSRDLAIKLIEKMMTEYQQFPGKLARLYAMGMIYKNREVDTVDFREDYFNEEDEYYNEQT
jgi:hypothetical protein